MNPAAQWYFESLELYQILCIDGKTEFNLHTFKKNEIIFSTGDPSDHIYFVKKGRVQIYYYSEEGSDVVKSILSTVELFGELALSGKAFVLSLLRFWITNNCFFLSRASTEQVDSTASGSCYAHGKVDGIENAEA